MVSASADKRGTAMSLAMYARFFVYCLVGVVTRLFFGTCAIQLIRTSILQVCIGRQLFVISRVTIKRNCWQMGYVGRRTAKPRENGVVVKKEDNPERAKGADMSRPI